MLDQRTVFEQANSTGSATASMKSNFENAEKAFKDFMRDTYEKTQRELDDLQVKKRAIEELENKVATFV